MRRMKIAVGLSALILTFYFASIARADNGHAHLCPHRPRILVPAEQLNVLLPGGASRLASRPPKYTAREFWLLMTVIPTVRPGRSLFLIRASS